MKRIASLLICFTVSSVGAQTDKDSLPPARTAERVAIRGLLATVGGVGLGFLAGAAGYQADLANNWSTNDGAGLGGALVFGGLGYVAGSALGSSIPALGTGCSYPQRLRRASVGAFGTLAVAVVAAVATGGGGIVLTLGAPVGAAVAHGRC
jgi:hypothetical protein